MILGLLSVGLVVVFVLLVLLVRKLRLAARQGWPR